jgi:hypothetical protein
LSHTVAPFKISGEAPQHSATQTTTATPTRKPVEHNRDRLRKLTLGTKGWRKCAGCSQRKREDNSSEGLHTWNLPRVKNNAVEDRGECVVATGFGRELSSTQESKNPEHDLIHFTPRHDAHLNIKSARFGRHAGRRFVLEFARVAELAFFH